MSEKTTRSPIEVRAKTTFSFWVRSTIAGSRPGSFLMAISDVEEYFRHRDDVLQVEEPAQDHLDGQGDHGQQQHHEDGVPPRPQQVVVLLQADGQPEDLAPEGQE